MPSLLPSSRARRRKYGRMLISVPVVHASRLCVLFTEHGIPYLAFDPMTSSVIDRQDRDPLDPRKVRIPDVGLTLPDEPAQWEPERVAKGVTIFVPETDWAEALYDWVRGNDICSELYALLVITYGVAALESTFVLGGQDAFGPMIDALLDDKDHRKTLGLDEEADYAYRLVGRHRGEWPQ